MKKILEMANIRKEFPGVIALDNVKFDLYEGEVHTLLGENGAGKSTLMKIIAGVYKLNGGEIFVEGEKKEIEDVNMAKKLGIGIVYQELELINELTVEKNLFLGSEIKRNFILLNKREMYKNSKEILKTMEVIIDPHKLVKDLGVAEKQLLEISKVLSGNVKILILDEPTSALESKEIKVLFEKIKKIKKQGIGVIYISHKLEEVLEISDRVTILRDGKYQGTYNIGDCNEDFLISRMVGRSLGSLFPKKTNIPKSEKIFEIENFSNKKTKLTNINLTVQKGEIVGVFGLMGSGKTELAKSIMGNLGKNNGSIKIFNEKINNVNEKIMIDNGISIIPEDRRNDGIIPKMNVAGNISISGLNNFLIDKKEELKKATEYKERFNISCPSLKVSIKKLSGGNQQKAIIARSLYASTKMIICDEPTRGIDVGAKSQIYELLNHLASEGLGVLLFSSELPELINLCDRIIVLKDRKIAGELEGNKFSENKILSLAMGGTE